MALINFFKVILKGMGQIMLQNNAITGFLFLIGVFYNSIIMGLGALLGVFAGTIAAFILKYKKRDIYDGLYGFNGALTGIALAFFFEFNILLICFIIFGAILSSLIMNFMHKKKLSPYTFPFVLSTWFLIVLIEYYNLIPQKTQKLVEVANLSIVSSLGMGFGQVMFQASIISGIVFLIAILINSRLSAIYAFIGSFIGMIVALLFSFPLYLINIGMFGFNGVLCGIAFADKKKYSLFYAVVSISISVFIIYGMMTFNWIALTAPFVFATWITLALRKFANHRIEYFN